MVNKQDCADPKSSDIVFFLGAGASVKAGVPTTFSFVDEYVESIEEVTKKDTIEKIIKTLERWKKERIDIELLLETLTKLSAKDQEPLLSFYSGGTFILKGYFEKYPLINDLKNFIKSKAIIKSEEKIRYLEPFRDLIEESRPLDIISVNYDTCIEQFCNLFRLTYQDGFDVYWNPAVFQEKQTDIRLYKIHGSVMWYQSDRSAYMKLPVMAKESQIRLITGEKAENLMLYPMRKWDFAEPLLELLVKMKDLLESESCKLLIVIGYSFRDDHIVRILFDAARKNKDMKLILIDPHALEIYQSKLKYYDIVEKIPSSLNERVICLPYFFENIFPFIKNRYLRKLREGFALEVNQHKNKLEGMKPDLGACLQCFADAEYIEKIEIILENEPIDEETNWPLKLDILFKMAVNLIANGELENGVDYLKEFSNLLEKKLVEKLEIDLVGFGGGMVRGYQVEFEYLFKSTYDSTGNSTSRSYLSNEHFRNTFESLSSFCQLRSHFVGESDNRLIEISKNLDRMSKYFDSIKNGKIPVREYLQYREGKIPDVERFQSLYKSLEDTGHEPLREEIIQIISKIEMDALREIIKEIPILH